MCCAALFCGFCAAAGSCPSLHRVLRVLYGFLLQPSFCAAARRFISFCPESGLNHVCVCETIFFCFCWAPLFRVLFLRDGSLTVSGLKDACLPFCSCICPREWLESCLLCLRSLVLFCFCWAPLLRALFLRGGSSHCVRAFAGVLCVFALAVSKMFAYPSTHVFVPFFLRSCWCFRWAQLLALCLRGGSSPSDLAFSSVLSGLLVEQVFWRFARRFILGFLPRSGRAAVLRPEPLCLLACNSARELFLLSRLFEVRSAFRSWFPPRE